MGPILPIDPSRDFGPVDPLPLLDPLEREKQRREREERRRRREREGAAQPEDRGDGDPPRLDVRV